MDYIQIAEQLEKIASEIEKETKLKDGYIRFLEKRAKYWVNDSDNSNSSNKHLYNSALLIGTGMLAYPLLKGPARETAKLFGNLAKTTVLRPTHWLAQTAVDWGHDIGKYYNLFKSISDPSRYKQHFSSYLNKLRQGPPKVPHDFGWSKMTDAWKKITAENPRLSKWLKLALLGSIGAAAYNWGMS